MALNHDILQRFANKCKHVAKPSQISDYMTNNSQENIYNVFEISQKNQDLQLTRVVVSQPVPSAQRVEWPVFWW